MDWNNVVIVGTSTVVAGISYVVARVNLNRQHGDDAGKLALGLVENLQRELERQRRQYERELDHQRSQHTSEINELKERVSTLQRIVDRLERENAILQGLAKGG